MQGSRGCGGYAGDQGHVCMDVGVGMGERGSTEMPRNGGISRSILQVEKLRLPVMYFTLGLTGSEGRS